MKGKGDNGGMCSLTAQKSNHNLSSITRSMASRSRQIFVLSLLCSSEIPPGAVPSFGGHDKRAWSCWSPEKTKRNSEGWSPSALDQPTEKALLRPQSTFQHLKGLRELEKDFLQVPLFCIKKTSPKPQQTNPPKILKRQIPVFYSINI